MKTRWSFVTSKYFIVTTWIEDLVMKNTLLLFVVSMGLVLSSCSKSPSPHAGHADSSGTQKTTEYWTCSMHPQVHMDKPGARCV